MKPEYDFSGGVRGKYAGRIKHMANGLHQVRRFPAEDRRVESGAIMFGDDWPGLFLRGDDCHLYVHSLRDLLFERPDVGLLTKRVLEGLLDALESSNCANNDAFPAWHQEGEHE